MSGLIDTGTSYANQALQGFVRQSGRDESRREESKREDEAKKQQNTQMAAQGVGMAISAILMCLW